MSVSFIAISQAKTVERLSPIRPLLSIFHPAHFISLIGQFAIHLGAMVFAVSLAKAAMPANYRDRINLSEKAEFEPSILNTVVWYMSTVQQCCVFGVNYKGRPFMQGLTENAPLMYSLGLCASLALACATEALPSFNAYIELVPFPKDTVASTGLSFRDTILSLLVLDVVLTLFWDRLITAIFAPEIFRAQTAGWTTKDAWAIAKVVAIVSAVVYMLGTNVEFLELIEKEMELIENGTSVYLDDTTEDTAGGDDAPMASSSAAHAARDTSI